MIFCLAPPCRARNGHKSVPLALVRKRESVRHVDALAEAGRSKLRHLNIGGITYWFLHGLCR